jgi:hypothetical protein
LSGAPYQTNLMSTDDIDAQDRHEQAFQDKLRAHIAKTLGNGASGIWIMAWMMVQGNTFTSIFTGNSKTYYLSGGQDFVNIVADTLYEVNPDAYHAAIDLIKSGEFRPAQTA